ncbi:hypothetical protein [Paenibacillus pinihumi]|uniref:hypothetical protein n=1 Tax=Paenibacillus pinihumi TaxID=669462 RepID=UPI00041E17E3|nr:hypothetical protein [Paenibacillus pinihumi]
MGMLYEIITRAIDREEPDSTDGSQEADLMLKASHLEAERKLRAFYAQEEAMSYANKERQ